MPLFMKSNYLLIQNSNKGPFGVTESGKFASKVPHRFYLGFLVDDNIELEPRSDCQRKAKLWQNVNIKLVLLLLRVETLHSIQILLIRLKQFSVIVQLSYLSRI